MKLHEMLENIKSKDELADFIDQLRNDLDLARDEWENPSLEQFLEAIAAWVRSMDNCAKNMRGIEPDAPNWSVFAKILYAGKIYE